MGANALKTLVRSCFSEVTFLESSNYTVSPASQLKMTFSAHGVSAAGGRGTFFIFLSSLLSVLQEKPLHTE